MNPLISVIIPIYNVESFLEKNIISLLSQTYNNYEVILVNDGSPDRCGAICDHYANESNKIKVLHIENGGVNNARNQGMKIAKGDFFAFVDGDDWVEPDFLKDYADNLEDDYTVVVQDKYRDGETTSVKNYFGFKNASYDIPKDFEKMIFDNKFHLAGGYPWNKIYSAKVIRENNLHFDPTVKLSGDEKWNMQYFTHVKKVKFIDKANYHYQHNDSSISNGKRPFDRELLRYQFRAEYFDFIRKNYNISEKLDKRLCDEAETFFRICIMDRIYKGNLSKTERLSRLKTIANLPKDQLYFLKSNMKFRNMDYNLLKNGQIQLLDIFKLLRLKLNR